MTKFRFAAKLFANADAGPAELLPQPRLGPPHNHNFWGLFELITERDSVLYEIQNRIIWHKSKQRYFRNNIQNELINLIAREAEKVLLAQLKQTKCFAPILY